MKGYEMNCRICGRQDARIRLCELNMARITKRAHVDCHGHSEYRSVTAAEVDGDPVLGPEWIKIKDCLPEKHQYVLLLADRYWNMPDGVPDMKVTASGYLAERGTLYWSVFGERGFDIDAFTHWMPIPDVGA